MSIEKEISEMKKEIDFMVEIANYLPYGQAEWAFINEKNTKLCMKLVHKKYGEEFVEFKLKYDAQKENEDAASIKAVSPQVMSSGYMAVGTTTGKV